MDQKKVLMICKETYSIPFHFLEKLLIKDGFFTGMFFVYPEECVYQKCKYNEITLYKIAQISSSKIYDMKEVSKTFIENYKNPPIDYTYLKSVEKKYTHYKTLNLQLLSSQTTSRYYHYREKFNYTTNEQNMYLLELCYRKVEEVLEDFKPDYIIDLDTAELVRTIINEVAYYKKIKYITIEHPRYKNYKIPSFNLGLKADNYFIQGYYKNERLSSSELAEEYQYILDYRKKENIMPDEYHGSITAKYDHDSFATSVRNVVRARNFISSIYRNHENKIMTRGKKDCILFTKKRGLIKDFLSVEIIRQRLFRRNKYFSIPKNNEKYIYMPLHLIPESTTFVKAPYFVDELSTIEQVSKSLPIDMVLYVKEHQSMLGERPLSFYKKATKLPNVKIVQLNYYKDPKPWIENSVGVITVTGTGAYEAALLGKKSIILGDVPFEVISSVKRVQSPFEIAEQLNADDPEDNTHSCAAYIRTVKEFGTEINLNYIINQGYEIIQKDLEPPEEYKKEIAKLFDFFLKAFEMRCE